MRICTITCQNAENYGARLQTYALSTYIASQNHEVKVIDYCPDYMTFHTKLWYWPRLISIKQWAKLFLQVLQRRNDIRRHRAFDLFSATHIPLSIMKYYDVEQLRECPPIADVYIAGSDQIWNTQFHNGNDAAYYLDFGDKNIKRISYAASFATKSLANGTSEFVKTKLKNFDVISVRESSGLKILYELGYTGHLVVDPVFLLSAKEWDDIAITYNNNEHYILVYDFMGSNVMKIISKRLASLLGCKIYSVGSHRLHYADKNFLFCSPETFISLIRQSKCVISNSFHGTVFSMVYRRNFFVVKREDGLNDRMDNILNRYNLTDRMIDLNVSNETLINPIDYINVEKPLHSDIEYSKAFLHKTISQ